MPYNTFTELAEQRFSVRKFTGKSVSAEAIEQILHAGHVAPTACNNQPQKIYVLQSESALEKFRRCTVCHFDAPLAFLVCYDKNLSWKRSYDSQDSGWVDASIVATHMMLQAHELGIGSTWVMHFIPEAVRTEFSLPENIVPVALLPMGYPVDDTQPHPLHSKFRAPEEIITIL